jgi:hypothetical protein
MSSHFDFLFGSSTIGDPIAQLHNHFMSASAPPFGAMPHSQPAGPDPFQLFGRPSLASDPLLSRPMSAFPPQQQDYGHSMPNVPQPFQPTQMFLQPTVAPAPAPAPAPVLQAVGGLPTMAKSSEAGVRSACWADLGVAWRKGKLHGYEDRYVIGGKLGSTNQAVVAVVDGHGGDCAAEFVQQHLAAVTCEEICARLGGRSTEAVGPAALEQTFLRLEHTFLQVRRSPPRASATPAAGQCHPAAGQCHPAAGQCHPAADRP